MPKLRNLVLYVVVGICLCLFCAQQIGSHFDAPVFDRLHLPAGFPTHRGMIVIWAFLSVLTAGAGWYVFGERIQPRRKRNVFLNLVIFVLVTFMWTWFLYVLTNFAGAIALAVFMVILALVIWLMFLVTHRYGGYLFTPVVVWTLYCLYLSIGMLVVNRG